MSLSVSGFGGNLSSHPFNMVSAVSLLYRFFIILRYVPSIPHVSRTFIMKV